MNTPKTFLETPGLCSSIMKLPQNHIEQASTFQKALLNAKSNEEIIDIFCRRGSSMGWFSDMPDGLFEKLQAMRTVPYQDRLSNQLWFQDDNLPDPNICQVCEE